LPAYFKCLAATASADDFARTVHRVISDFAEDDRKKYLESARAIANAEQKTALRRSLIGEDR